MEMQRRVIALSGCITWYMTNNKCSNILEAFQKTQLDSIGKSLSSQIAIVPRIEIQNYKQQCAVFNMKKEQKKLLLAAHSAFQLVASDKAHSRLMQEHAILILCSAIAASQALHN